MEINLNIEYKVIPDFGRKYVFLEGKKRKDGRDCIHVKIIFSSFKDEPVCSELYSTSGWGRQPREWLTMKTAVRYIEGKYGKLKIAEKTDKC